MKNLEIVKGWFGLEFKIYQTDSGKWAFVDSNNYGLVLDTKFEILKFLVESGRIK